MDLWLIEALETLDLKNSHTQKHTGAIPPIQTRTKVPTLRDLPLPLL